MSTNYFNPISYLPRQPVQTPINPLATSATLPTQNTNWTSVTGWSPTGQVAAPNQGAIGRLVAGIYGSGTPGQAGYVPGLNERASAAFGAARNNARDALRGYGGITFRQDDPNTPNIDESLMVDYAPDQLGRNERQAVLSARAAANARGMLSSGFADQQIGAALQRVGEEARTIVNQYATQIKQISDQYFDPLTGLVNQTLNQIEGLYGADTRWSADQDALRPPPPPPPAPTPAQASTPTQFQAVGESGGYGSLAWTGTSQPNMDTIRSRYPYPVITTSFRQPDGKYVVYVRPA